jgi:hypothetical protein
MRKAILLFAILFGISVSSWAKEIVLKGIYQGENIYVMNPFSSTGVGYCIYEITVNGQVTTDEINSSAFEIDLTVFDLKKGDPITIVVKHKDGCVPKIINPEALKPKSTFVVTSIDINRSSNVLTWTTVEENGKLPFVVEQFRWNKWIPIATVDGKGTPKENSYTVTVVPHSGANRFRVKQLDFTKKPRYSKEVNLRTMIADVTFSPKKAKNSIDFSDETDYEIYNYYGTLVMKGREKSVNISKLEKGDYFLNYDNKMDSFSKK